MSELKERRSAVEDVERRADELLGIERRLSARLVATTGECAAAEAATSEATVEALLADAEPQDEDGLAQVLMLRARERDTRRASIPAATNDEAPSWRSSRRKLPSDADLNLHWDAVQRWEQAER